MSPAADHTDAYIETACRAAGLEGDIAVCLSWCKPKARLHDVVAPGLCFIVRHYSVFYDSYDDEAEEGEQTFSGPTANVIFAGPGKAYTSGPHRDLTLLQLCVLAEEAIRTTQDYHHVFMETLDPRQAHDLIALAHAGMYDEPISYYSIGLGS